MLPVVCPPGFLPSPLERCFPVVRLFAGVVCLCGGCVHSRIRADGYPVNTGTDVTTTLLIKGNNFGPAGTANVTVGGAPCAVNPSTSSHTLLECETAKCIGAVVVTVSSGRAATVAYSFSTLVQVRTSALQPAEIVLFGPAAAEGGACARAGSACNGMALCDPCNSVPQVAEIVEVSPLSGPTSGGTPLTIRGERFGVRGLVWLQEIDAVTLAPLGTPVPCVSPGGAAIFEHTLIR